MMKRISWYDADGNIKHCQTVQEGLEDASCPEDGMQWIEGHPELLQNAKVINGQIVNGNNNSILPILEELRIYRDLRLKRSDWTQMPDAPLTPEKKYEWAEYRQQLRDLPSQYTENDNIDDVVFPTPPT